MLDSDLSWCKVICRNHSHGSADWFGTRSVSNLEDELGLLEKSDKGTNPGGCLGEAENQRLASLVTCELLDMAE